MKQDNPDQPHDFSNSVIAIFDAEQAAGALRDLTSANFEAEVLAGAEGRSHLDATADGGLFAGLRKLARSLGDETRIVGALDAALQEGKSAVSVDAGPDRAPEAARIMEEHGGSYIWRFGEWSFNQVGDTSSGDNPEQSPEAMRGTVDQDVDKEA